MVEQKKAAAIKPAVAAKAPRKLVPRTAPRPEARTAETSPPVSPPAGEKPARAKRGSKTASVDETVARHQAVLADALQKAQAISYEQPLVMKQEAAGKPEKPAKAKKHKLVRDSYAMPEGEYVQIGVLKKRMLALGSPVKKSELLRAGIALLAALGDEDLKATMARVERIRTGRPAK